MPCRRDEERYAAGGTGALTWQSGSGKHECRVNVRNISQGGVQLISKRPLQIGWSAHLRGEQFDCIGSGKYCNPTETDYLIGIRFLSEPFFRG